jgi:hypothetical protein
VRVLGDKRTSMELANTVGLMFCADAIEVQIAPSQDFETAVRGVMAAYDASLALRIPSLHFWAPYCVKPGIEARDFPNKIPAVFNYYSIGTAREKAARPDAPQSAAASWPPVVTRLPPQIWPRRSSPLFLHMIDTGGELSCSLHFYQDVVNEADQESFTAALFQTFSDVIGL